MSRKIILSGYIFELYYPRLTSTGNLLEVSGRRLNRKQGLMIHPYALSFD